MVVITKAQLEKQLKMNSMNDRMWSFQEKVEIASGLIGDY